MHSYLQLDSMFYYLKWIYNLIIDRYVYGDVKVYANNMHERYIIVLIFLILFNFQNRINQKIILF